MTANVGKWILHCHPALDPLRISESGCCLYPLWSNKQQLGRCVCFHSVQLNHSSSSVCMNNTSWEPPSVPQRGETQSALLIHGIWNYIEILQEKCDAEGMTQTSPLGQSETRCIINLKVSLNQINADDSTILTGST